MLVCSFHYQSTPVIRLGIAISEGMLVTVMYMCVVEETVHRASSKKLLDMFHVCFVPPRMLGVAQYVSQG